jgi:hypothetical protein
MKRNVVTVGVSALIGMAALCQKDLYGKKEGFGNPVGTERSGRTLFSLLRQKGLETHQPP